MDPGSPTLQEAFREYASVDTHMFKSARAEKTHMAPSAVAGGRVHLVLVGVLVLLVLGVGAGAWMLRSGETDADTTAGDIHVVTPISFEVSLTASGDLRALKQTELRNKIESQTKIVEIIPEGTYVAEGDVLVQLSTEELERELENDLLSLASATNEQITADNALEIQESNNESALQKAELAFDLATISLRKWKQGDVVEKRQELALDRERSEREVERLTRKLEKTEDLFEQEYASYDELQQDRLAKIEADANLKKANLKQQVYEEFTYEKEFKELQSKVDEGAAELSRTKRRNESNLTSKKAAASQRQAPRRAASSARRKAPRATRRCDHHGADRRFGCLRDQHPPLVVLQRLRPTRCRETSPPQRKTHCPSRYLINGCVDQHPRKSHWAGPCWATRTGEGGCCPGGNVLAAKSKASGSWLKRAAGKIPTSANTKSASCWTCPQTARNSSPRCAAKQRSSSTRWTMC